jgi:hypothetical protein
LTCAFRDCNSDVILTMWRSTWPTLPTTQSAPRCLAIPFTTSEGRAARAKLFLGGSEYLNSQANLAPRVSDTATRRAVTEMLVDLDKRGVEQIVG